MKKKSLILILTALAVLLAACGRARPREAAETQPPAAAEQTPPAPAQELPPETESAFPLLLRPFSELESEDMINHNARRCALLAETWYFQTERFSDGSRALVRYAVIDNGLHERSVLVKNCAAEALCAMNGRLYFLGDGAHVESVSLSGGDRRSVWDEPCRNLQLYDGALYVLTQSGALVCLDTGETLLEGCSDAFLTEQGIFYTAADGRAHLYDRAARTDTTLSAESAEGLTVIGTRLYYVTAEDDGRHLCALDLMSGERFRQNAPFGSVYDIISERDGGWSLRVFGLYGEEQLCVPLDGAFAEHVNAERLESGRIYRCRNLDGWLRTDEILSTEGESLGLVFVMPEGGRFTVLAAENRPE